MELLIAIALAGLLLSILFQFFIGASKSSEKISNNTVLINEAQLAQQFVGSRLIEAAYLFPTDYEFSLGTTDLTKNHIQNSSTFKIGRDSVVAGLIAPGQNEVEHLFFAYYTMPRSAYIAATQSGITLDPNPNNDDTTWIMLEYRKSFLLPPAGVSDIIASDLKGGQAYLLAEYIEPAQNNTTPALDYTMFNFDSSTQSITFNLRMLNFVKSNSDCSAAIRHPSVQCSGATVSTPVPNPFSQEIVPRNFFIGSDFN